jgi:hypothetical protein
MAKDHSKGEGVGMPEEFITRVEYEKRHDDLSKHIERVEARVDKVEATIDTKDAESQKVHSDIRREQSESYLKLLEAVHSVKDEVAKDRLATLNMESTLKSEMFNNNTSAKDALNDFRADIVANRVKSVRWIIGLIITLMAGVASGIGIDILRVLLTGKP